MDFEKILAQLRGQRDLIEQVIVNIEKLAHLQQPCIRCLPINDWVV